MGAERIPLRDYTGPGAVPPESLRTKLGHGERLLNLTPVTWFYSPWSSFYPNPPARGAHQSAVVIGVSNTCLHAWNVAPSGGPVLPVPSHVATRRSEIASAEFQVALRRFREGRRFHDQEVVVAEIREQSGRVWIHAETPFKAGLQVRDALALPSVPSRAPLSQDVPLSDELAKLAALHRCGALTRSEWEQAKADLIGVPTDRRIRALDALAQLHQLHQSGALTEYEYKRKKLELLTW